MLQRFRNIEQTTRKDFCEVSEARHLSPVTHHSFDAAASPYTPERIEIAAQEGRPFVVRLKKRPVLVKEIVNMWRIDEEWWRKPISRLYFSLELENGARVTVFRDLLGGTWYRQNWT